MIHRLSNRIAGCLLAAATALTIPAVSSASVPSIRSFPNNHVDANAGIPPNCLSANQIGNQNSGIHPPCSSPYGLTYGEWSARWWQWLLAIPPNVNPNFDGTSLDPDVATVNDCAQGQSGPVWFLAGTFGGPAERAC